MIATPAPIVREVPCPAVTQMLKYGAENPLTEVSHVQRILRDVEGVPMFIDGEYNEETRDAIIAFQKKYSSEILGPWGKGAQPSGVVSLTTAKKLNQLACGVPLTLDEREMKFISVVAEKAARAARGELSADVATDMNAPAQRMYPLSAGEGTNGNADESQPAAYYPYSNDMMTASAASAGGSIAHRFGTYMRALFR